MGHDGMRSRQIRSYSRISQHFIESRRFISVSTRALLARILDVGGFILTYGRIKVPFFYRPPVSYITRNPGLLVTLLATCFHAAFLLALFLNPEDRDDMFLRNVGWLSTGYTALYPIS
jgi:hypothetical protein